MMAAVQQKVFPTMQDCVARWVDPRLGSATEPDPHLVSIYEAAFRNYRNARETMRPIWKSMAALRHGAANAA